MGVSSSFEANNIVAMSPIQRCITSVRLVRRENKEEQGTIWAKNEKERMQ